MGGAVDGESSTTRCHRSAVWKSDTATATRSKRERRCGGAAGTALDATEDLERVRVRRLAETLQTDEGSMAVRRVSAMPGADVRLVASKIR